LPFREAYSSTSDTAQLQSLIDESPVTTSGNSEVVLQRDYHIDDTINLKSNLTLRGSLPNAGVSVVMDNSKGLGKYMFSGDSLKNIKLINLTFDLNLVAKQVHFRGDDSSPIQNITVDGCVFKRLGKRSWGLAVLYDEPETTAPKNYNSNILVRNCLFDGTGAKASENARLELAIFSNCQHLTINQCTFQNVPAKEKDAGLAIYGQCRDVSVKNNKFLSNVSDMYIQQATSVLVENNYFASQVRIMDSRALTIRHNDIENLQIIDFDSPSYDLNTAQYRGSRDIVLSENRINTELNIAGSNHVNRDTAIEILLHNNVQNMPKRITITGNRITTNRVFLLMKDMRDDAKDYIDNLEISNNKVLKTSAISNQGIIELRTNPNVPKDGLDNCSIRDNYFARSSVSEDQLPWDVLVTTAGVSNLIADDSNDFGNLGVEIIDKQSTTSQLRYD
jgi:hypothetical protein